MKDVYQPQVVIVAAGCFWGVQFYFDQIPGVLETRVGYIGGKLQNPTYEDICYKNTGHAEAVHITFNPHKVTYETLLKHFFRMHDPTQLHRQGPDIGTQYRSAIFYADAEQLRTAKKVIAGLTSKKPVVTSLEQADTFWLAEDYHQKFTERTGRGMCHVPYQAI